MLLFWMSNTIRILDIKIFCWLHMKYRIWKIYVSKNWTLSYFPNYLSDHFYLLSNNLLQRCHHYCTLLRNIRLLPLSPFSICLINSCISPYLPYLEQKYFWLMRQFFFFLVEMMVVMSHSVKSRSWTDSACNHKQIWQ